jgi:DNA polymerase-3 subunit alpha
MSNSRFVHLHVHTEFSLADSTIRVPAKPDQADPKKAKQANLLSRSVELGLPALAVTDLNNLFALVKFYKAAEGVGIKPIAGADVLIAEEGQDPWRMTLLCRDREGYLSLSRLLTRAWMEGHRPEGGVAIHPDWLKAGNANLFALAGRQSLAGRLALDGKHELAEQQLADWQRVFGDGLHLELTRTGREGEETFNQFALMAAGQRGLPVVASNDVRFLSPSDFSAHEARVHFHRPRAGRPQAPARVQRPAVPEVGRGDVRAVRRHPRCDRQHAGAGRALQHRDAAGHLLPAQLPGAGRRDPGHLDPEDVARWPGRAPGEESAGAGQDPRRVFRAPGVRAQHHHQDGLPGYFLIVADFIQWGKNQGIPIGPGRGSGAGSLVAWALKITDLDPLPYNLLFERFLNPERVSMPDFDIDFCMDRRDEVIDYVARKYGRERVSQIITYGTMAAKAVVRDSGRVLGFPYGLVDGVSKLIPNILGIHLKDALGKGKEGPSSEMASAELIQRYETEDDVRDLIDLALQLEDLTRNAGKHAGGVVIGPEPLSEFCPLYAEHDENGLGKNPVTQFDKNDVEEVGLVKFDFLGLRTLTIIDWAVKAINKRHERAGIPPVDIAAIPLDDTPTYKTSSPTAIPARCSSSNPRHAPPAEGRAPRPFRRPDRAGVAVPPRPDGPDSLLQRAQARPGRDHLSRSAHRSDPEGHLRHHGVPGAGDADGADRRRLLAGRRRPAAPRDGQEGPKWPSTARSSAKVRPRTAWPQGRRNLRPDGEVRRLRLQQVARRRLRAGQLPDRLAEAPLPGRVHGGHAVVRSGQHRQGGRLPRRGAQPRPDRAAAQGEPVGLHVRSGDAGHHPVRPRAIKGVGQGACEAVVEERLKGGPFKDLLDFCTRVGSAKLNRRTLEAMINCGALDELGRNRASLMLQLPEVIKATDQMARERPSGQNSLFGGPDPSATTIQLDLPEAEEWPLLQRLNGERDTLGFYLSGHPFDPWRDDVRDLVGNDLGSVEKIWSANSGGGGGEKRWRPEVQTVLAGQVVGVRRKGESQIFIQLEDGRGRVECSAFSDAMAEFGHLMTKDRILVVKGGLREDEFNGGFALRIRQCWDFDEVCANYATRLSLRLDLRQQRPVWERIDALLDRHRPGRTPPRLDLLLKGPHGGVAGMLDVSGQSAVRIDSKLMEALRADPAVRTLKVRYSPPWAS